MGLLIRIALVAAVCAGCYEPELTDCQVTCSTDSACVGGQVCDEGFCVAPAAVGTCGQRVTADARETSTLLVTIKGRGRVELEAIGESCQSTVDMGDACAFEVDTGTQVTLVVVETEWRFDKWEGDVCRDEDETCTLELDADLDAIVKFRD